MQVAQAYVLGLVDDDGVGVGDVEAVLDDGGAEQDVVVAPHEIQDAVFQVFGLHLAVGHADTGVGQQPVQDIVDGGQFFHLIVQEEYLAAAVEFVVYDAPDLVFVEEDYLGLDGDAVGRGRLDDGQVAGAEQAELQGARDRGGREREGVDADLQLAELFLGTHAEFLLFVYHQQAEVPEREARAEEFVCADDDVYLPLGKLFLYFGGLFGSLETADEFDVAGEVPEALGEGVVVLQGEDGCRHQHGHLFIVGHRLEGGPDGDFGFAEAHVAADEAVHRVGLFHVALHGSGCGFLAWGVFVHEGGLEFVLHIGVARECEALGGLALGVQLDEVFGYVLDLAFGATLEVFPCLAAEFVDLWRHAVGRTETRYLIKVVDAHEHHVAVAVNQFHHFLGAAVVVGDAHQSAEGSYAVVDMHHIVAYVEGIQVVKSQLLCLFHAAAELHAVETVEDFVVGVAADFVFRINEAGVDIAALDEFGQTAAVLGEDAAQTVDLALLFPVDEYLEAVLDAGGDVGRQNFEVFVEGRLRGDAETHRVGSVPGIQGDVGVHPFKGLERGEERPLFVDVGRIEPDGGVGRKYFQYAAAILGGVGQQGGYYFGLVYRLF